MDEQQRAEYEATLRTVMEVRGFVERLLATF